MDKMTLIVIFIIFTAGAFVSSSAENNVVTNAKKTLRNNSPCIEANVVCPDVDGPDSVYSALPDCTKFCQCSNGIPYLHNCPSGLHFNPILNVCDWPNNAGCAGGITQSSATSTTTTTTQSSTTAATGSTAAETTTTTTQSTTSEANEITTTTEATKSTAANECIQANINCPAVDGPDSVYAPLPDCTKFCQCSNGVPYLHDCPAGLHFNPVLNVCDWPSNAGCTEGSTQSTIASTTTTTTEATSTTTKQSPTTQATESTSLNECAQANITCPEVDGPDSVYAPLPDCTKFCQCSNGVPYLHDCPAGLHFNPVLNVCDWPSNAGCIEGSTQSTTASTTTTTTEATSTTTKQSPTTQATESTSLNECAQANITCPEVDGPDSVYAPLPDCTKFCQCSNGVPHLHECPGGLHFNPVLNVCDWPNNAGCTGGSTTQSTAGDSTTTTAKSTTSESNEITTTEATESTTANECVQANITCPKIDGADSVYAPLPDCTKFCQCSSGVPYLHQCHGGLHFNPVLNVCDWPNNAGCTGGSTTQSTAGDSTTTTPKSTTSEVNEITTTEATESTTANECVQANITCPEVDGPDSVYAPLPDCTKFCQCSNGVPYLHECHGGLHFNPVLNVCDWPNNAGCTGGSTTQSTAADTTTTTAKSTTSEVNEITTTEATESTTANQCVQANITCPEVDGADSVYAPLPDCTKFCQCSNGVPYLHECHGGLHFNPILNVCDWPNNAGCTGGSTTQSTAADTTTTTAKSTTSEVNEITTTEETESTTANECVQANITCPEVDGADSVYAPLTDCTKFCQCSNGVPYLHECHGGLHFNPVLNVCDWPNNAGCTGGSTTQSTAADTTTTTSQSTTSEAIEITTTEATESTTANECVQANITCPEVDGADSVYAPLPDCTKFCQCSNGVPYLHECHGGLHFNPVLNVCDWPNNAGCIGDSTTQSTAAEISTTTTKSTTSEANEITTTEATESTTANECVQANITCPKVDGADSVYAPLPDCTKFCQCSNGVPYLHECHGGLHFNPVLNVCDWPSSAGCTGGSTDSTQSTASSNTTTEKSAATEKTETSATESPTTLESSTTVDTEEITTNNEDKGSTVSSNTTTEKSAETEETEASATESPTTLESITTVETEESTTHNEDITTEEGSTDSTQSTDSSNTTTEKSAVSEETAASATESPTNSESSTTVESEELTTNNEDTTTEEGSGSNTSENSQDNTSEDDSSTNTEQSTTEEENISTESSTASVEPIPCSTVTITETTITTTVISGSQYCLQNNIACPAVDGQDSLYSALPDCTKFCQCSNGIPYLQSCPDGLHFNPEINVCDWPLNAGCANQNSTTSPNTVIETTTECSADSTTIEQITDVSTGQEQESTSEGNSSDESTSEDSLKTTEDGLQTTEDDVQTTEDGLQTTDSEVNTTKNASSITENDEGETTTEDNPDNGSSIVDDSENTTIDSSTISEATTTKVATTEDVTISDVTTGTETNGTELCLQTGLGLVCPTVDGPDSVYGPGPECTTFCQCSNGVPYLHICNDGLHFNPILNVCDWPEAAGCVSSSTTEVPDTSSIIENDEGETTTENNNPDNGSSSIDDSENTTIDSSTISEATTIKVTTTEDVTISDVTTGTETNGTKLCLQTGLVCPTVDGPDSVYGPGPECTNFCQCSNGVPYLHICKDGLHFNPILNVCDWPEAAGCASSSTTVVPDTSSTVNQNDDNETTEGDVDDQENGRKICEENNVVCPEVDPEYPVFTALPDCTKYCKCSNGTPYLFNCPDNLHFNPDLNVCDWPQNAGCKTPVYV